LVGAGLSVRWVASSFRSVFAERQDYRALVHHFEAAMSDIKRDKKERCTHKGMLKKISSAKFVLDLGLMCDALRELSELSIELQDRNTDLYLQR